MLEDLKILIVDDDLPTIESVSLMLKRLGIENLDVCESGSEAFKLLAHARQRFDCVISDVRMPEGTGLELLHQIRTTTVANNFRPDMCVILMSGIASIEVASAARELDVNAFLVKPFSIYSLHKAIVSGRRRSFPLNLQRYFQMPAGALQVA